MFKRLFQCAVNSRAETINPHSIERQVQRIPRHHGIALGGSS
jgi:hypothetical protein